MYGLCAQYLQAPSQPAVLAEWSHSFCHFGNSSGAHLVRFSRSGRTLCLQHVPPITQVAVSAGKLCAPVGEPGVT
jgi:hypothetical protein